MVREIDRMNDEDSQESTTGHEGVSEEGTGQDERSNPLVQDQLQLMQRSLEQMTSTLARLQAGATVGKTSPGPKGGNAWWNNGTGWSGAPSMGPGTSSLWPAHAGSTNGGDVRSVRPPRPADAGLKRYHAPPKFSGETISWEEYLVHFELAAEWNRCY